MTDPKLAALAERWSAAKTSEFGNAQTYLTELTEALGVERPRPAGSGYEFEYQVRIVHRDGSESVNRVDLFKEKCFLLEAKHAAETADSEIVLRKAFGQASTYAAFVPGGPPPYLMVMDVARRLRVWDRWSGSYGGYQAAVRDIDLRTLADRAEDIDFLRAVWERPHSLDPGAHAARVTREIATKLAQLAAQLEQRHDQETVARFLIRCVFSMFAEDVGLLPHEAFRRIVHKGTADPAEFDGAVHRLWAAMDKGDWWGPDKLLRFNGHFFADQQTIPLTSPELAVLFEACRADWKDVEPSIFGTLLTRALDREERHRLGAEFTPREYVERLVRPTLEEPVRERWTMVQGEVLQLRQRGTRQGNEAAVNALRQFLVYLRSIRVLDPACGSGNFLYVALSILKEIELEATREIEAITGQPELAVEQVSPRQFHGIEVKLWAREVAELCLWVGHHQWWRRTHGHTQPPEPVLEDTQTLEWRDAVLAWDDVVHRPEKDRPDPTPRIPHPVTGELVPDPNAKLPYYEYVGARQAEWPQADYIVGNPPYMGNKRMREAFGDGYVDGLRESYADVPDSADYVMYWWSRVADSVVKGTTSRGGLITTNSITQSYNRAVVETALRDGARVVWAIPTHPWVEETHGAAVRVAMTVLAGGHGTATRIVVNSGAAVVSATPVPRINADLTAHADVAGATRIRLRANEGLSSRGFTLVGRGFVLEAIEADELLQDATNARVIRTYLNGKDLANRPRGFKVVDFGSRTESQARAFPVLFDLVRSRVKPQRDATQDRKAREGWWLFGRNREALREALAGIDRFVATPYVAKHRFFVMLGSVVAPDEKIVCVALDAPEALGVLSSTMHQVWALAAGSRLGVGNDPTYNNSLCFDPFPFPDPSDTQRHVIASLAEALDAHRKEALARDEAVTMTGMYNVVEKLRTGEALTPKERKVHEIAACGVLKDLHDELDAAVAQAYGWSWPMETEEILEKLVALHDERVAEEKRGIVRWLRPEYQIPRFGDGIQGELEQESTSDEAEAEPEAPRAWPADAVDQLTAVRDALGDSALDAAGLMKRFRGAKRDAIEKHLATLEVLGVVQQDVDDARRPTGRYRRLAGLAAAA